MLSLEKGTNDAVRFTKCLSEMSVRRNGNWFDLLEILVGRIAIIWVFISPWICGTKWIYVFKQIRHEFILVTLCGLWIPSERRIQVFAERANAPIHFHIKSFLLPSHTKQQQQNAARKTPWLWLQTFNLTIAARFKSFAQSKKAPIQSEIFAEMKF